jgi:DNA mismatch repair protein MutL
MLRKISILPDELINKIAAGEIIERPSSVVRELIDNALDAGAQKIDVTVMYGGKKLITVSDNGCGMERDDAVLALERHSTSKIQTVHDLCAITTLGFRGEALASISAVSKMTLTTSTKDSPPGTRIEVTGNSKVVHDAPAICGTIIEVRDLFYNIPARRKFLKSTSTEFSHIADVVIQRALAFPAVGFTLIHDDRTVFQAFSGDTLESRLMHLNSSQFFDDLVKIASHHPELSVTGFVSHPRKAQKTKRQQYMFINKRPVKDPTVAHAVTQAYREFLYEKKYPPYYLFIEIDPLHIDVNVHPAKLEVRFEDSSLVYRVVLSTIKRAFNEIHISSPSSDQQEEKEEQERHPSSSPAHSNTFQQLPHQTKSENEVSSVSQHVPLSSLHIGGAFVALRQHQGGLILVDQHAAHERVLYEKFLKRMAIESQALLFPAAIDLPPSEFSTIISHREELKEVGIDVEDFGNTTVAVRSLPREFSKVDIKEFIMDIAQGLREIDSFESDTIAIYKAIASRLACHNAIRGDENLSEKELSYLFDELKKTDEPEKCPHGRPTMIHFSLNDLKKLFKR